MRVVAVVQVVAERRSEIWVVCTMHTSTRFLWEVLFVVRRGVFCFNRPYESLRVGCVHVGDVVMWIG